MSHKLENYLRTYRRRAGLSQDEMAFLLGATTGSKVSRYERFRREPSLRTALAYEAVFHVSPHDLFAGTYATVEREALVRMKILSKRLARRKPNRLTAHKLAALDVSSRKSTQPK